MSPKKALLLSLITLSMTLLSYLYIDQYVARWYHVNLTPTEEMFFLFITQFGDSTFYLIGFAIAGLVLHYYRKHSVWRNRFIFLFAAVSVSGIFAVIIKVITGRHRPSELLEKGLYGFDFFHLDRALTSFPSGHTATAFALATAIGYLWPRYSATVWIFALSIGISRIAISAHYPSDVLAGALTGVLSVHLIVYYWNKKIKLPL